MHLIYFCYICFVFDSLVYYYIVLYVLRIKSIMLIKDKVNSRPSNSVSDKSSQPYSSY